jgi:pimeloyl-ACP methyl ester carboxylesterase
MLAALLMLGALHPCAASSSYLCGTIVRPLDPTGGTKATIRIHYEFLAQTDRHAQSAGVIIANEGGPGYGTTGSRDAYRELFRPLLQTHDLLLMDNRGTGQSGAVNCEPLQSRPTFTKPDVAACGTRLGRSAYLYRTALAADDLAAIMDELHITRADMYGDSYGTFFVQTFAALHPTRVRSIVLDGAYPIAGLSPWYPEVPAVIRRAFDAVCERAPSCSSLPGSSISRIERLLADVRHKPMSGMAPIGGAMQHVSVGPADLAFVMASAGASSDVYRELDAAARAYELSNDPLPLLRLTGETYVIEEASGTSDSYSRGLFTAVSCADDPQAYDMRATSRTRETQWLAALAAELKVAPSIYAPFTIDEWMGMPLDISYTPLCVSWPAKPLAVPVGGPVAEGTTMPPVPALVISGELDTITPAAQGDAATARLPHALHIVMRNSVHVDALGDPYDCASRLAREFVATLTVGDTSCADRLPPYTLVPVFPESAADFAPAMPAPGNHAGKALLRVCTAAVQTVGDAVTRASILSSQHVLGLHGGSFRVFNDASGQSLTLNRFRLVPDLIIDGAAWDYSAKENVGAIVTILGAATGVLTISWDTKDPRDVATVDGRLNGSVVHATAPSP